MRIERRDGPRGGQYLTIGLSDGRALHVSRKPGDERVWLGQPGDPSSYANQRGGIGTIDKLLDEWRSRVALEPAAAEMYAALAALKAEKDAGS
jgi:hypothetical protein